MESGGFDMGGLGRGVFKQEYLLERDLQVRGELFFRVLNGSNDRIFYRFVEVRVGLKVLSGLIVVFSGIENKVLAI